ncbi:MAG: DUF2807 domain-containing protein [Sphingobacteriaceae bacterium]|nr:DUF2807 domain-containing protein [Sphingobacteriaceae bacterium]
MKTSIKTLITIASAVTTLTAALPANLRATEKTQAMIYKTPNFRKISIKGNVEVILVQRPAVGISYADDNEGSVKVTQQGEAIRISSLSKERCKLVIYVNDIYRIEADQNAVVKTEAKLASQFLQIILKGNAIADIDTSCEGLYTEILDNSALRLKGNTQLHTLIMGNESNLIIDHFVATRTDVSRRESSGEKIAALVP